MDQVLKDMPHFAATYLDNVVIFSETWEEHVAHLREVLHLTKTAGLTIHPGKCAFAWKQVPGTCHHTGGGQFSSGEGGCHALCAHNQEEGV